MHDGRRPEPAEKFDTTRLQLRDQTAVLARPIAPSDGAAVRAFVHRLSEESVELRFFSPVAEEAVAAEVLGDVRSPDRLSLVLETCPPADVEIVGHAEFARFPNDRTRAEVGFLIADGFQGRGAGTILLRELARRARAVGVATFAALLLSENMAMRDVFTGAGFPFRLEFNGSETRIELDIRSEGTARWEGVVPRDSSLPAVT